MNFYTRSSSNLQALSNFFQKYAQISSQHINLHKSTVFGGSVSQARLTNISSNFGFDIGSLSFTYIGVIIFKGRPKAIHFQSVIDRIHQKISSCKVSQLSSVGRNQLIKIIIYSMLIY